jgi:hypothetical protein
VLAAVIDALAELKEREEFTGEDDLVFTREGEHLNHFDLRKRYYAALERAGLRRLRFHDLRHAFGSAAITKLDAYAVQSYMGHQDYSTTQRYLHHKPRREDAAALEEAFGKSASPSAVRNSERTPNAGGWGASPIANARHQRRATYRAGYVPRSYWRYGNERVGQVLDSFERATPERRRE